MAEVLTVVAEEMGRVFGMVWSGVGVAVRLNNQVMTTVLKATTRIVQLLLLLTHKVLSISLQNKVLLSLGIYPVYSVKEGVFGFKMFKMYNALGK